MKTRACFVLVLSAAWVFGTVPMPPNPEADERLTLSTPRQEYLLGEPVLLDLCFRDHSKETTKVMETFVWPNHYEAPVWIARGGERFQEFSPNTFFLEVARRVFRVEPGDSLQYHYRVVGAPWKDRLLPFGKPGEYRVYVMYSLWLAGAQRTVDIASNVVRVRVTQPVGEDAKVWQKLNDPWFLTLLQTEELNEKKADAPRMMAELLHSHPTCGYVPALRHALARIYFHHRIGLPPEDQRVLAEALGITDIDTVADQRLDARRKDVFAKGAPLSKTLVSLTKLGVFLDASAALKGRRVSISEAHSTLRESMGALSDELEAAWERRGEGYFLVPFQASPALPPEAKSKKTP